MRFYFVKFPKINKPDDGDTVGGKGRTRRAVSTKSCQQMADHDNVHLTSR